jgi:hypothetical protein
MSAASKLTALMRQMGAPHQDGFNPIAPRSHRILLDHRFPEEVRILAWVLWRTIDKDPQGEHGPVKKSRTYYAHDERGQLDVKQVAADLAMELSNARDALKRAAEKGLIHVKSDGKICPHGNAPNPVRQRAADICTNIEGEIADICTDIKNEALRLYFQQLPDSERAQRVGEYKRVLAYRKKLEADAIAAARDAGQGVEDEYLKSIGFASAETAKKRGRPREERGQSAVQLTVVSIPDISVQIHSVQNLKADPYRSEIKSAQKSASLFSSSEVLQRTSSESGDIAPVREALDCYGRADDDAARQLLAKCRAKDADATAEEIAGVVREKGDANMHAGRKRVLNPIGFLLEVVPKCFPLTRKQPLQPPPEPTLDARIATLENLVREMPPTHPQLSDFHAELDALRAQLDGRAKGAHA